MKYSLYLICIILLFVTSCKNKSQKGPAEIVDTIVVNNTKIDSAKNIGMDADKWISINEKSDESSNSFGFVPGKNKIEKKLKNEFENIDPLEYYLSENIKFTDKTAMIKKREELEKLMLIYNTNYYDLGHIPERRNNMDVMLSLVNTPFSLRNLSETTGDFDDNKRKLEMKSGYKKVTNANSGDLKSILNNAVQLINLNELRQAEETINYLEKNGLSKEYLLYYNKSFIRYSFADFSESIRNAEKAIVIRKDFYLGRLLIGDSYLSIGQNEKAFQYYSDALQTKENIVSLERVAYSALLCGKADVAENCYFKILEKYNGKDRLNYMAGYALALAYNGNHDLSMKKVMEIKGIRKDWSLPYLIEGCNYLLMGKYGESEKSFNESEKRGEKTFSILGRAIGYYCQKDYSKSSMAFYSLQGNSIYNKFEQQNPPLLIYSGYSFVNSYDFTSACQKFIAYSQVRKRDDCYYIGMSICSFGFDDFKTAESYFDSVSIQRNNLSEYYYLKGIYALRNKKYQSAEKSFEKSLDSDKKNLRAINGLGAALNGLQSFEKSVKVFNEGLKISPDNPYLLFNKASAEFNIGKKLYENNNTKSANDTMNYGISLMKKVTAIKPSFFTDLNIGNAYASIKDSAKAMSYYRKINNPTAEVNIGVLYTKYSMNEKARKLWEKVHKADSSFTLAGENLKVIDMPYSSLNSRNGKDELFRYYENYYFEIGYHWKAPIPDIYQSPLEPLVPLGYTNFKFAKTSSGKKSKSF